MKGRDVGAQRQRAFLFDQRFCVACRSCQMACKDLHDLSVGVNWRRVMVREAGQFPKPEVVHLSMSCNHCAKPACLETCPTGAILKRQEDGVVLLDSSRCTGCRACADACPYGVPQYDPATGLVGKCDLCADLLSRGEQPGCVSACTMRVLHVGWLEEMAEGEPPGGDGLPDPSLTLPALRVIPRTRGKS